MTSSVVPLASVPDASYVICVRPPLPPPVPLPCAPQASMSIEETPIGMSTVTVEVAAVTTMTVLSGLTRVLLEVSAALVHAGTTVAPEAVPVSATAVATPVATVAASATPLRARMLNPRRGADMATLPPCSGQLG
jgi:hypothetical protein